MSDNLTDEWQKRRLKSEKRINKLLEYFDDKIEKCKNNDRYLRNPDLLRRTLERLESDKIKAVQDMNDARDLAVARSNRWLNENKL